MQMDRDLWIHSKANSVATFLDSSTWTNTLLAQLEGQICNYTIRVMNSMKLQGLNSWRERKKKRKRGGGGSWMHVKKRGHSARVYGLPSPSPLPLHSLSLSLSVLGHGLANETSGNPGPGLSLNYNKNYITTPFLLHYKLTVDVNVLFRTFLGWF